YKDICKVIERSLLKPNPGDTFRTWIEQIVEDMLVCSAGSSEILKAGDPQRPFRMYPTDSFSIDLYPDWDGKLDSYRYAQRVNGQYISLKASEMMYIRMNPRTNTPFGLSPLEMVWESVDFFISAHRSAGKQTSNPFIRRILNLGKSADSKAVSAFRVYWEQEVQGRGSTPIIGGSESPSILDLGATDDKALFIEWQRFLIEVVAIAFDISPKKLGQTKDVNRSTADSEDDDTEDTIQSIAENIVEHINNHIIDGIFRLGDAVEFKFHYATKLKHQKLKADIDAIYLDRRVVTPDEVRDSLARKALPNQHGEVLLMPGKTAVIDINKARDEINDEEEKNDLPPEEDPPDDEQDIEDPNADE
ncbi:MAG: phage portal protein, partial [Paenibacillus macerans]|nr:phage portal protein [Paenibacillus macerans]